MAQHEEYRCSRCGAPTARDLLTVKKAVFLGMGVRARMLRSRVCHWLCPSCVAADRDWNREAYVQQPTYEEPALPRPDLKVAL
jgi:hypothetical protein